MDRIWIVVANAARARVYERDPDSAELIETRDFVHPQSRQKAGELAFDRAGHTEHSFGTAAGRGSTQYEPPTDVRTREHAKFARELAQFVEQAVLEHRCPGWMLFASASFLGELKVHLGGAGSKALIAAEPSDLTSWGPRELARRVIDVLEAQM